MDDLRYRRFFEISSDLLSIAGFDGYFKELNAAWEPVLGYGTEELLAAPFIDFVHPDDRAATLAALGDLTQGSAVLHFENRYRRKDGTYCWLQWSAAPFVDDSLVYAAAREVTQLKVTELGLKESNRELQAAIQSAEETRSINSAILDATDEALILISPDLVIRSVNRSFETMFPGGQWRSWVGRPLRELDIGRRVLDPDAVRALLSLASDPETKAVEIIARRAPHPGELQVSSNPVHRPGGEHLGRLYVVRDVTRERELDRMKTEFVSTVSHELRTPLTSIKGYVDLLLDGASGEVTNEQQELLTIVQNNAGRLTALVNDLLDISRIEAGGIELHPSPVALDGVIRSVATALRPSVHAKRQTLTLDLPPGLPAVFGDIDRITQILTNLLSNAHKYTPQDGRITVTAINEGEHVRVDVSDTGIGLTPDEQSRLFTRFYRARNRATQDAGGTGLGLAITRSLVERHGGQITVSSTPGEGSTFSFTLLTTAETSPLPDSDLPTRSGGRILIVDDEPDIADLLRRYLERGGHEVLVATSAAEGLRLAQANLPDLIVADIVMPDADGFTLLEWLKSDQATARIPVVMLSILPDTGRGRLLGAIDYLTKPVQGEVLLERLERILGAKSSQLVLVVDDDDDIRRLIAVHLRRASYRVAEAGDGEEAIASARRLRPDIVLLDVRMPGMDGVAVLGALRQDPNTSALPVIMMSASPGAFEQNRSAIDALGATALLKKPADIEELAAVVAHGLARVPLS